MKGSSSEVKENKIGKYRIKSHVDIINEENLKESLLKGKRLEYVVIKEEFGVIS